MLPPRTQFGQSLLYSLKLFVEVSQKMICKQTVNPDLGRMRFRYLLSIMQGEVPIAIYDELSMVTATPKPNFSAAARKAA
jgi:hypothetical protein